MPKVIDRLPLPDAALYETDFFAWTEAQAERLRAHAATAIDWDNLAEEIESVGRSEKREIHHRLEKLLMHLLKWHFQPKQRCMSWQSTISGQRNRIRLTLDDSPSLRPFPQSVLPRAYDWARQSAAAETGLPLRTFPAECPYPIDAVLDIRFMPGPPWSPDDLIRD